MVKSIILIIALILPATIIAQVSAADSVQNHVKGNKLSLGGYGEVAFSRYFYSDNVDRYNSPDTYKNAPGHGKFDIPHAVLYVNYDFGKGWTFNTEIEFEHGGTGSAYEKEAEEGGEWESEQEKGGEVELEQFWIQKSFAKWANLRIGHIVVPVGLNNARHEPLNFFTVYRPEGENCILPSTWHQTGIDFWGRYRQFRYEVQLLAGLVSDQFSTTGWINKGAKSPLEYDIANKYGVSLRIDNYSIPGLRLGVSGYYGHTVGNSFPAETNSNKKKGALAIGSVDFTFNRFNWIVRGQADFGYLGDTDFINSTLYNRINKKSPYHHSTGVSSHAYAIGVEAGWDIFSQIEKLRQDGQKLYVFGRYDNYNPCSSSNMKKYDYCKIQRMAIGLNYLPMKQIAVKAEYSHRFLESKYNNEPSVSIGIAYQGWFM